MDNYIILIEKTKNNYSAYSPDIDGCIATGQTKEEARKNFIKALEIHIEGLKEDGIDVPKPSTSIAYCAEECTGVLNVRIKKSIHYMLTQIAKQEGVSVSHLVNDAIIEKYLKNNGENKQMYIINGKDLKIGLSTRDREILDLLAKDKTIEDVSKMLTIKKQALNKHIITILNEFIDQYKYLEKNKIQQYYIYTNDNSIFSKLHCSDSTGKLDKI